MHDAEIQKAIDDYMEMERKARAWDLWREMVLRNPPAYWNGVPLNELLDALEKVVPGRRSPT